MELGEFIEKLQDLENMIGSAAQVFVQTSVDEVELYDIVVRKIDEHTYEVVVKGRL